MLYIIFSVIPKSLLSYLVGAFARINLIWPFNMMIGKAFVRVASIDMSEAEQPLSSYRSIEDIFVRRLKPGLRKFSSEVCSPCDGTLIQAGRAEDQGALQIKGLYYSLSELCLIPEGHGCPLWFMTIYLAPHNYHRVHLPISGRLREVKYIPGALWPVNPPFVRVVPQLYVCNERLVFKIELSQGFCYLVMVGALNVGRMVTPFWPDLVTNNEPIKSSHSKARVLKTDRQVQKGDELGTFMLGSTVVLIFDEEATRLLKVERMDAQPRPLLVGQSLMDRGEDEA